MGRQHANEKIEALEKPVTMLLCPPQIPHGMFYD
jgi:hypothetical protein